MSDYTVERNLFMNDEDDNEINTNENTNGTYETNEKTERHYPL